MLDALTLDQIRTFVVVADAGSFRSGATRLRRAQSAVSHAIANLESQLGVALFDRSSHRPTLTPAGRTLLEDARAVLLKVDFMRARARGLGEGVEIELPIMVDVLFPLPIVGAAVRDMRRAYPSVRVRMSVEPLGGPPAALLDGRCTLGITVGEDFPDPRIECELLLLLPFIAVVAASHPLAARARRREPIGVVELADHLQIVLEDPTPLSRGRDFGVLSPETWRVRGQDTKRELILAGVGWGRLPLWAIRHDLAERRLVRIPAVALGPKGETIERAYLARRTDAALGPAAQALRAALLRHAREARTLAQRNSRTR